MSTEAVDALTAAKNEVLALQTQREALELEAEVVTSSLKAPGPNGEPPLGIKDPLIDSEGFPLAGYDIYTIRHLRHRLACIQTDHKNVMARLEKGLHALHSIQAARAKEQPESAQPQQQQQQQPRQPAPDVQTAAPVTEVTDEAPADVPFARVNSVSAHSAASCFQLPSAVCIAALALRALAEFNLVFLIIRMHTALSSMF
jgi:Nas2 N_terminal domain